MNTEAAATTAAPASRDTADQIARPPRAIFVSRSAVRAALGAPYTSAPRFRTIPPHLMSTPPLTTTRPVPAAVPGPFSRHYSRRRRRLREFETLQRWTFWPYAILVAAVFLARFVHYILRHTSLPYYDSIFYLQKTWNIAADVARAAPLARLNPNLYLSADPRNFCPLLPGLAALFVGGHSSPQAVAVVWAVVRVAVVVLAIALLSRHLRSAAFVPAAVLVIFAAHTTGNFICLYMMDEPFAAFGLLAFVLIIIDDRRRSVASATAAAAGMLALFMVKPVALSFLFPLCLLRAARALYPLRRRAHRTRNALLRLLRWAVPYLLFLAAVLWLYYGTAYGPAIREQYRLGQTGYWRINLDPHLAIQLFTYLLPPWLLVALLLAAPLARRWRHKRVLFYGLVLLLWWPLFYFGLTYTVQGRLMGQAMPAVVTAFAVFLCRRPLPALLVTAAASVFFALNTLVTAQILPHPQGRLDTAVEYLSPIPEYDLRPIPEVGLVPFARQMLKIIPAGAPTEVVGVFGDIYVEPNTLALALRAANGGSPSLIQPHWTWPAPQFFALKYLIGSHWFVTKTRHPVPPDSPRDTGLWTNLFLFNDIITDPQSPLHPYFVQRAQGAVHVPGNDDTLVLWELPRTPPPSAQLATLRWVLPRIAADDPRQQLVRAEIQRLTAQLHK